jgi:hypothetical protein
MYQILCKAAGSKMPGPAQLSWQQLRWYLHEASSYVAPKSLAAAAQPIVPCCISAACCLAAAALVAA